MPTIDFIPRTLLEAEVFLEERLAKHLLGARDSQKQLNDDATADEEDKLDYRAPHQKPLRSGSTPSAEIQKGIDDNLVKADGVVYALNYLIRHHVDNILQAYGLVPSNPDELAAGMPSNMTIVLPFAVDPLPDSADDPYEPRTPMPPDSEDPDSDLT